MKGSLALSLLTTSVAAHPSLKARADADAFDYIVVGGGTSGLVVANRLSEDPSVSVLVIEAGDSAATNPNVTSADGYGLAFGTEVDYAFQTTPQSYANNATTTLRAGKALGGTSAINGLAYTRAETNQIDAWQTLGNEGWNWSTLYPYYLKAEHLQVPDAEQVASSHLAFDLSLHGLDGPLYTGFSAATTNDTFPLSLNSTYQALGVPWNADGDNGSMVGFSPYAKTLKVDSNLRWDAAQAYYYPYQNRTNLKVLLNTTANRLTWAAATNGSEATASGVEVTSADGTTAVFTASKEVVLSAGALVSPLLLELSGVGNPAVLSKYGIETVVDLPTVGENLQDQINNELIYTPPSNFTSRYDGGGAQFVAYPSAAQVYGTDAAADAAAALQEKLASYAEAVSKANGGVTKVADLQEFFDLQYDLVFGAHEVPYAEILIYIADGEWGVQYWGLLPFSRGSVHIGQKGVSGAVINPNYFMLDFDAEIQLQTAKFIREIMATQPFAAVAGVESSPGFDVLAADASDAAWKSWLTTGYRSNFHPVATAAMMPRDKGGVVDPALKVYGTSNVRVVDASVLPFQVCGHLTSTLYAVAERAADIIKAAAA